MSSLPQHGRKANILADIVKAILSSQNRNYEAFTPITMELTGWSGVELLLLYRQLAKRSWQRPYRLGRRSSTGFGDRGRCHELHQYLGFSSLQGTGSVAIEIRGIRYLSFSEWRLCITTNQPIFSRHRHQTLDNSML
jgi:hypothetical protein